MTEWSNVPNLKLGVLPSTIGSNPILSVLYGTSVFTDNHSIGSQPYGLKSISQYD